jgi:hypothetical protein
MKQKFTYAAILLPLVLLSSCGGEEDPIKRESIPSAIGFSTSAVTPLQNTRATVLDLDGLKAAGFRVTAYSTSTEAWSTAKGKAITELMANQAVTWSGSAWAYTPVKYWPDLVDDTNYGKVSFFAWNDAGASNVVYGKDSSGTPTLTCTVPNTYSEQYDLVADAVTDKTGGASAGNVDLTFNHLFSQIGFTAKLDQHYPGKTVKITSAKVRYAAGAVKSKGVYTFGSGNHGLGGWSSLSESMSGTGDEVGNSGATLDNTEPLEAVRLNSSSSYLMLLPQAVAEGAVMVDFTWTVDDDVTYKHTISLPAQTWESGNSYDYNLVITLDIATDPEPVLNAISFGSVTVTNWKSTSNISLSQTFAYNETDNVTDGKANCFMVIPGNEVTFDVARAYTYEGGLFTNTLRVGEEYTGDFLAAVVWDDNAMIDGTPTVAGSGNTAQVTVKTNAGKQGNALVKIYKKDDAEATPVWSYHIWATDYDGTATATTTNGYVFMDRNLGATAAALTDAGRGLLYQWGRKDPFPDGRSGTAGYAAVGSFYGLGNATPVIASNNAKAGIESIKNPTRFYRQYNETTGDWLRERDDNRWNTTAHTKSIHDPCPAGWRVPIHLNNVANNANSPWYGYSKPSYGINTGADWGANALYPATGYRDIDGNLHSIHSMPTDYYHYYGGTYWSATSHINNYGAINLHFDLSTIHVAMPSKRANGYSVRCAKE